MQTILEMSGVVKTKWFQQYMRWTGHHLSTDENLTEEGDLTQVNDAWANFVCLIYCPKGIYVRTIPDIRWYLFFKYLAESSKLPPTVGALDDYIECVRLQSSQAIVMW